MFKLHKKTIKTVASIIKVLNQDFQEQLFAKFSNGLTNMSNKKNDWEKFIELDLNEIDYDEFLNEILNNVDIQDRDLYIEKIKLALKENDNYLFEIFDREYHICIEGSYCVIYLKKEESYISVNKRLYHFDALGKELFNREKDILSNLERRNLHISPRVFLSNNYIIKMEKCDQNLYDYISDGNKLDINEIVNILSKIEQLHNIGILHRDLHPGNLMSLQNEWLIIDYNVAHIPTRTGSISLERRVGWIDYVDPVLYQSTLQTATVKTDIYSIGRLINFILTKSPKDNNHFLSEVSSRCIDEDHSKRYNSIYEVIKDIKRCSGV